PDPEDAWHRRRCAGPTTGRRELGRYRRRISARGAAGDPAGAGRSRLLRAPPSERPSRLNAAGWARRQMLDLGCSLLGAIGPDSFTDWRGLVDPCLSSPTAPVRLVG